MEFAVSYLKAHPETALVTIQIGGNDLGLLQFGCNFDSQCILTGLPGTLASFARNLTVIYTRIREESGYKGPIIAVNYNALNYLDPVQLGGFGSLNAIIAQITSSYGGKRADVADSFTAFFLLSILRQGKPCVAGYLYTVPDGTPANTLDDVCDPHPTQKGQDVLADLVLREASGK